MIQIPDGFNPNDRMFKSCCCHSKTFTIVVGILEVFIICFLLVAVLPDINTRLCDNSTEYLLQNETDFSLENLSYLENFICHLNIYCLLWAIIQIASIALMLYGLKTINYYLFVPHLVFRFICIILVTLFDIWLLYITFNGFHETGPFVTGIIFVAIFLILLLYTTWIEIRCAHFVKRSQETGFSISIARPIGPATISLSERDGPQQIPIRQLPPLRHTRNPYKLNENNDNNDHKSND